VTIGIVEWSGRVSVSKKYSLPGAAQKTTKQALAQEVRKAAQRTVGRSIMEVLA
jgi:hypothetical protein